MGYSTILTDRNNITKYDFASREEVYQRPYWSGFPIVGRQLHTASKKKNEPPKGPTLFFLPQKNALDSDVVPALILTYYTTQLLVYTLIAKKALTPDLKPHPFFPLENSLALEAK